MELVWMSRDFHEFLAKNKCHAKHVCFLRGNVVGPVVHANDSSFEIISVRGGYIRIKPWPRAYGAYGFWTNDSFLQSLLNIKIMASNEPLH